MLYVGQKVKVVGEENVWIKRINGQIGTITYIEGCICFVRMEDGRCWAILYKNLIPVVEGDD